MKPLFAYLSIAIFWACLYLPGLGSREIRGEEWRRTLPGRTMMNTGQWIVPFSGGLPFLRKPPLINWASAASFKLTGVQNEWTARLPGVLLMLGAALGIYSFSKRVMGSDAAFVGTVFFLTSIGCVEKGRIAEIEVYYIAFTGLAFTAWLAGFMGKMNRWASWLIAGFFLGLGLLAKGPMHLLFFYLLVVGVCWKTRRWRELISPPHLCALVLAVGIFLAWAVPFLREYGGLIEAQPWLVDETVDKALGTASREPPQGALATWRHQLASRMSGEEESSARDLFTRVPRALVMFLPWVLFVPLWWRKRALESAFPESDTLKIYRGLCWGAVAGFAFMMLVPGSSPRYVAPLVGPVAVLLGWIVSRGSENAASAHTIWRWIAKGAVVLGILVLVGGMFITFAPPEPEFPSGWQLGVLAVAALAGLFAIFRLRGSAGSPAAVRSCFFTLIACAFLMLNYTWLGTWRDGRHEIIRPTSLSITDAMQPEDGPLQVFHLGQQPYSFYLPVDSVESSELQQLPSSGVRWMLTTSRIDRDFRPWFERRYGPATKAGEWTGAWGEKDQDDSRRMVLLRFAGK